MTGPELCSLLSGARFRFGSEKELQDGIELVLKRRGLLYMREKALGDAGVIDFLVGDIGIEVKVDSSTAEVTRQLHRYAGVDDVRELVLVTSRGGRHRGIPGEMNRKPVRVVALVGSAL